MRILSAVNGSSRRRTPHALKIAFAIAGMEECKGPSPASLAPYGPWASGASTMSALIKQKVKITTVAVKTVEGAKDDISAPGQCVAALDLLTGLPDEKKASYLEPNAGHYGIFAGSSWRNNIRPLVLDFFKANSPKPETEAANINAVA